MYLNLISQRAKIEGFIVFDYADRYHIAEGTFLPLLLPLSFILPAPSLRPTPPVPNETDRNARSRPRQVDQIGRDEGPRDAPCWARQVCRWIDWIVCGGEHGETCC